VTGIEIITENFCS